MGCCRFILNVLHLAACLWAVQVEYGEGLTLGAQEAVRIYSILVHIGVDKVILAGLYPTITGLDSAEDRDDADDAGGAGIFESVLESLSTTAGDGANWAPLFDKYYHLYPMGFPLDQATGLTDENYFVLNGDVYSKPDDVFYMKSKDLKRQTAVPDTDILNSRFDVVIGWNAAAPLITFFGCPSSQAFREFNRNLFAEAIGSGKIRFVWRPTCSYREATPLEVDFPLELTFKKDGEHWDSIVPYVKLPYGLSLPQSLDYEPTEEELEDLDIKIASLIAKHYSGTKDFDATIEYFQRIVNNFPLLFEELTKMEISDAEINEIEKSNHVLEQYGIDYFLLGLFVNGQNIKLTSLDPYSLVNLVQVEYDRLKLLTKALHKAIPGFAYHDARNLVNLFSEISMPTMQELQPIKVDAHRIPAFSHNVIYFNDIEKDDVYNELRNDASQFFEKTKFGEIPEFRQNWNELVFVIDFSNLEEGTVNSDALTALVRVLDVVSQGYPQRLGLLPITNKESEKVLSTIYKLKEQSLSQLKEFFVDLIAEKDLPLDSKFPHPDNSELLSYLDIDDTAIIIDGEIFPFQKNAWHYLLAKVIKRDVEQIKFKLERRRKEEDFTTGNIDVRGLLHLKSATLKHHKYTPDYFSDALYTVMDNDALTNCGIELSSTTKNKNFKILHTISLVDDFGTLSALQRLYNMITVKFSGVRVRVIHTGEAKDGNWLSVKTALAKSGSDMKKSLRKTITSFKQQKRRSLGVNLNWIKQWLPDIALEFLEAGRFMVLNGRFIHFNKDEIPSKEHFEAIVKREAQRTLDMVRALEGLVPEDHEEISDPNTYEVVSSILAKTYYHSLQINRKGFEFTTETTLSRLDLQGHVMINNFTTFESKDKSKPVLVTLVVDPVEERTQKILALIPMLQNLSFVDIEIVLLPTLELKVVPNQRVYLPDRDVQLSTDVLSSYDVEVDVPKTFVMSNITTLESIVIEVYCFDKDRKLSQGSVNSIGGVSLELLDSAGISVGNATTMETFGYAQFHVKTLAQNYTIRSTDPRFEVKGMSTQFNSEFVLSDRFSVDTFDPVRVLVTLEEHEDVDVREDVVAIDDATNVFTVLSSLEEEEIYKDMILKIATSRSERIVFWLLSESFYSKSLYRFVDAVNNNAELNVEVRFISYSWPVWIRPQRFIERRTNVARVLLLDVLFPRSVHHLVYMAPTSTPVDPVLMLRSTMKSKRPVNMFRMKGKGYWDEGYWKKLKEETGFAFYSAEPAFVVHMDRVRALSGGEVFRIHYQRLSADQNSLVNIGQDLLNDVQGQMPIGALKKSTREPLAFDQSKVDATLQSIKAAAEAEADAFNRTGSQREKTQQAGKQPQEVQEDVDEFDLLHDEL
ncbi:Kre5p KNAG_0E00460 [Huiozyma naganishii CBS 8797]|uniref:Killer toxin-resistance protein 5 n=1 Tax=Huiozyma naganishii (strain ATCC MYA-139 / BCRC 22969 / CBS 8797 / KCTC 17520 / NBRC 10181 / NCYC 3082 / Yp74L-3) TaxID=1071383 RepID=J7S6C5_HUIN7|nr:hypothetical protein KNAG_0E00460 [Kazachstania naganishii CBS 8797]CCK70314.1 hypothetical protein KNAG_0E00460 [Kazachstania naganishii CBS 8797]